MVLFRNILLLTAILLSAISCSKKRVVEELPSALVSFAMDDTTVSRVIAVNQWDKDLRFDTLVANNGRWEYRAKIDTSKFITFFMGGSGRDLSLLVTPKSRIEIAGRADSILYRGDSINKVWLDYQLDIASLRNHMDSIQGLYRAYSRGDSSTWSLDIFSSKEYKRVDSLWMSSVRSFVNENRDNPLSLLAIEDYYRKTECSDSIAEWMKRLSPRTRGYGVEKSLTKVATMRANSRIGGRMPFLRFINSKGETLSSNSFNKDKLLIIFLYSHENAFVKAVKSDLAKLAKEKIKKEPNVWIVGLNESEESTKLRLEADSLSSEILYSRLGINDPLLHQSGIVSLPTLLVINEKYDLIGYNCYGFDLRRVINTNRVK